jgi:hypothetical protein
MDDDRQGPTWRERVRSPDFWMLAGAILFFLAVFVAVLID